MRATLRHHQLVPPTPPHQPKTMSPADPSIPVHLPPNLTHTQLTTFKPYQTWHATLTHSLSLQTSPSHPFHNNPYHLRSITIQTAEFFSPSRLGFLKLKAEISTDSDDSVPGSVFMRGGSVAVLMILSASDDGDAEENEYVLLTVQPRIPAASLGFVELPAGMIDDSGTFAGAAAKEIGEETGLVVREVDMVDLTALAVRGDGEEEEEDEEERLQSAVYPSPGGCDEFVPIFLVRKAMPKAEIERLRGKLTGLREEGEMITLKVCKLRDLWRVAARDAKALAALALYQGLRREGKI